MFLTPTPSVQNDYSKLTIDQPKKKTTLTKISYELALFRELNSLLLYMKSFMCEKASKCFHFTLNTFVRTKVFSLFGNQNELTIALLQIRQNNS